DGRALWPGASLGVIPARHGEPGPVCGGELPTPSGREVRRDLRCQYLPAHHQDAGLFRPGSRIRRRSRTGLRPCPGALPGGVFFKRLALFAGTLPGNRSRPGRRQPGRQLRLRRIRSRARRIPAAQCPLRGVVSRLHEPGCGELLMLRGDLDIVRRWITPGSRVLDLGRGDGTLLDVLKGSHHIEGYGIEIDAEKITQCIARGINVIEADLDLGLTDFPDKSFDTVLMTNSLQALRRPDRTIAEMLRIGRECV